MKVINRVKHFFSFFHSRLREGRRGVGVRGEGRNGGGGGGDELKIKSALFICVK